RGGFEPETGLLNSDEPAPEPPIAEPAPEPTVSVADPSYRQLTVSWRAAAVLLLVFGLAALRIPAPRFGEKPTLALSADQARAPADAFLRSQSVAPSPYRHVTYAATHWGGDDSTTAKYFYEQIPASAAASLFEQNRPVNYWATRYFQSLNKEE